MANPRISGRWWVPGWVLLTIYSVTAGQESSQKVWLQEKSAVGQQYHVSCRVNLRGELRLPPEKPNGPPQTAAFTGSSAIDYAEKILEVAANGVVQRTIRLYERLDFQRRLGQQEQVSQLRPAARRMVILRAGHLEVPFSPDGPLTWSEIDRVRTDVFIPALAGLLPGRAVGMGEKWPADPSAVQELTDLEKVTQGTISCRLEQIQQREGQRLAQISFAGTVSGVSEDGASRHELHGLLYFDLAQNKIVYLSLEGKQWLLDSEGQAVGQVQGTLVITRQMVNDIPQLSETALRGLKLVPDEENTRLLFAEKTLGVAFVYPRRWTVRGADPRQIFLDEPNGGTLLLTLDPPTHALTGAQYQQQVEQWLAQQQATVHRRGSVEQLPAPTGSLERFRYEVTLRGERLVLDYYAIRQAQGGATLAGRVPNQHRHLLADLEVIARSLRRGDP
jgi:hypothetical protein